MEIYLIYFGKSAIAAGAFYLAFLLLFQNQKHFRFNRIYLPVSLALSFVIPLITFTTVKYIEPAPALESGSFAYLAEASEMQVEAALVYEWYHYLFGLYLLGTAGFLFYLILGHLKAMTIIRKSRIQKLFEKLVNISKKDIHPFSFFNKIVLSEKTLKHPNLEMIVEHENIHVKEKHTLDILFAEILFLFQWFNPFAWLIKDAIKNNLEYKTDQQIAKKHDAQTYQLAMVALADKKGVAPFLTALNGSQLKNRIIMMKRKTENKHALLKQLVVFPLLAILVMGLSNREVKTEIVQPEKTNKSSWHNQDSYKSFDENFKSKLFQNGLFILQDYGADAPLIYLNGKEVVEKVILNESDVKWIKVIKGDEAIAKFGERGKNGAMLFNTEKEFEWPNPVKKMLVNVDGKIIPSDNPKLNEYDTSKGFDGSEIIDALEIEGNKVNSTVLDFDAEKVTFYIQTSDYVQGTYPDFEKIIEADKREIETKETFYAVDGEIVSKAFFNKYAEDGFETVEIITGKDASEKYGNNYETIVDAKTGTANFKILKDTISQKSPRVVKILKSGDDDLSNALYLVDGVEVKNLEEVDQENVEKVDVLKGESATKLYGEKAKNGVVLVTTKNPQSSKIAIGYPSPTQRGSTISDINADTNKVGFDFGSFKEVKSYGDPIVIVDGQRYDSVEDADVQPDEIASVSVLKNETAQSYVKIYGKQAMNGVIIINTKTKYNSGEDKLKPLIVINGVISENIKIDEIDSETIESINVLKDESAAKKYGEKGKNGVIEITLKNGKESTKITSPLELRRFIAERIKYPVEAQENGIVGKISMAVTFDKNGKIVKTDKSSVKNDNLEEVVVTAMNPEKKPHVQNNDSELLKKEMTRIINLIPPVDIDDFKGKTINVVFNFQLQD